MVAGRFVLHAAYQLLNRVLLRAKLGVGKESRRMEAFPDAPVYNQILAMQA